MASTNTTAAMPPPPAAEPRFNMARYHGRRRRNYGAIGMSLLMTAIGLFFLGAILATLLYNGIAALTPSLFLSSTPAPGDQGGLLNAIFGTFAMTVIGLAIGAPIGILAGTWLAEYARGSKIAEAIQFINDILLSAPSIIIGLFVYQVMVVPMGHFSGWAGSCALAILVIPVVLRTTVDMLALVPDGLREAAVALGAPKWRMVTMICYRAAFQGMLTGVMLSVARISGETAPLLFTALNNQFWSTNLNAPIANLPVVIFQFALSPYDDWNRLAWGGALLITLTILVLNIAARFLSSTSSQKQ
jgi:phosphate transport system permease protein